MNTQETKCLNCGVTLTSVSGERLQSAHFDSSLPSKSQTCTSDLLADSTHTVIWARCECCWLTALDIKKRK
jgi:hypothetical protein